MRSQMIARCLSALCLTISIAASPAFADSAVVNSDMMLSGPSITEPIRLTVKHPKGTSMHVTVITDAASGSAVEFSAPKNADPTIAYRFSANESRDVRVMNGQGQEIWSLIGGDISVAPSGASLDPSNTLLTQLDRAYTIKPVALEGAYTLRMHSASDFLLTTDFARTDPAGTDRAWTHRRRSPSPQAGEKKSQETTIIISPSGYFPHRSAPVSSTQ